MRDTPRLAILETWGFSSPRRRLQELAALLSSELVAEPSATMLEPRHHPVTHSWEKKEPAERVGISAHPINTAQFAAAKIACYPFFAFLVLSGFLARVETSRSAVPL